MRDPVTKGVVNIFPSGWNRKLAEAHNTSGGTRVCTPGTPCNEKVGPV